MGCVDAGCARVAGPRCLRQQVALLEKKIQDEERLTELAPLSRDLLQLARERGRLTVRDAVKLSGANRNTIKLHLRKLVRRGILHQEGQGKGTWYRPA